MSKAGECHEIIAAKQDMRELKKSVPERCTRRMGTNLVKHNLPLQCGAPASVQDASVKGVGNVLP